MALVCQFRRDVAATQAHVDALLAVAAAPHLAFRAEQGRLLQGWTLAMQDEATAGVAHLRQALASPDMGPESLRPYGLATQGFDTADLQEAQAVLAELGA